MIIENPGVDFDPVTWRGKADVYFAYGKWIARSWPRPPNHPRTPKQLANWGRFEQMIALRKRLPASYFDLWKQTETPPERSWDDLMRSSIIKQINAESMPSPPGWFVSSLQAYKSITRSPLGVYTRAVSWIIHVYSPWQNVPYLDNSPPRIMQSFTKDTPIRWSENGKLCYKGRKMIPHYVPSESGFTELDQLGWKWRNRGDPVFMNDFPDGTGGMWYYRYSPMGTLIVHSSDNAPANQIENWWPQYCSTWCYRHYNHPSQTLSSYVITSPKVNLDMSFSRDPYLCETVNRYAGCLIYLD